MKNLLKNYTHEVTLVISYVFMMGLLMWFNSQSTATSGNNGLIYSVILFGIVLLMYGFTFVCYLNTNKLTSDLEIVSNRIKIEHKDGQQYLWDTYKNEENLFRVKILNERYNRFCKEQKRIESTREKSKSYGDIEDFINYDLVDEVVHKNILGVFPGTMTGLGILFTFFGLSICLQGFHTGTADEIMAGIDPLMSGIRVAFHTSIYGLVFSLVYNISYRKKIEESYGAIDEFVDAYREHVKPENGLDAIEILLEYQDRQSKTMELMSTQLITGMTGAFRDATTPQFDKLNATITSFAHDVSKAQTDDLKKLVDIFLNEMNKSVGDNFREVRDSMAETCKVQGEYSDVMKKSLDEISGSLQSVCTISTDMQQTVQQLDAYIKSIQALQDKLMEAFDKYTTQILENNETTKKQQRYLEEMQEVMSKNISALVSDTSETLTALVSETERCLMKLQQESGDFVETAEQATSTIIQKSNEWTEKMDERILATEQILSQTEQDISNSSISTLNTITQNVESFSRSLSTQADEQVQSIVGLKDQISKDLCASANRLDESVSNLSIHVEDALTKGFAEYSNDINETVKGLNETVRGIRTSTAYIPQITNDATKGLKSAVDMTETHINTVLNALDQIMLKISIREDLLAKDSEVYMQAKDEIKATVVDIRTQREQLQKLVGETSKVAVQSNVKNENNGAEQTNLELDKDENYFKEGNDVKDALFFEEGLEGLDFSSLGNNK
jgi:hypothetical protein